MIRRFDSSLFALCVADLIFLFCVLPFAELVQRRWPTWFLASARLDILAGIFKMIFFSRCFAMGFVDFFLKASRNCRVASQHEFRCRVLCDVSNGLPSSPPVKKVHANSPSLRPGHMHLLKRARFLDSRTPGPICFVPGFPAQF